jgi:hypothetical protein
MDLTEGSETSAKLNLTPGKYPKENIQVYIVLNPFYLQTLSAVYELHCDEVQVFSFFFYGAIARGGPWPPLQYVSKPLDPLLYPSIRLFPSFSGP